MKQKEPQHVAGTGKKMLDEIGVTTPAELGGKSRISKPPKKADIEIFVKAVKTPGAWSMETTTTPRAVQVEQGGIPNRLVFKILSRSSSQG